MNPNLVPPTPTMLPPAPPAPIVINAAQWRLWNFTDEALMIWQQIGPAKTQVFQIAVLVALILLAAVGIMVWLRGLSS